MNWLANRKPAKLKYQCDRQDIESNKALVLVILIIQ